MSLIQKEKIELAFDFVVIGGGTAGLAAAIAASRKGAKTAIIQDRPVFGGNSSSEIRVSPQGSSAFNAWGRETGIMEEWVLDERAKNHDDISDGISNSQYDLTLYESAKKEKNLKLLMNTSLRGVETIDSTISDNAQKIVSIHCSQLGSEKEFHIKATQFADCTGDATLGALSGAEFRYGREARSEFNEPMAPIVSDDQTMGATITMRAKNIGKPVPYQAPDWAKNYQSLEELGPNRIPDSFNRRDYGGHWWIEIGSPFHQIDDNQEITDELLKHVLGVWSFIKNHGENKKIAENYALEWVGMIPGKRESRRLVGDIILTEADTRQDQSWPDRIGYAGWFIDLHTMGGLLNKNEPGEPAHADLYYRNWTRVSPFSIPLRSLYSKNIENLWMAGRNISVSHVALGSTRVMMTHAIQGQAIGTAAALSIIEKLNPRQAADPEKAFIKYIQQTLIKDDLRILDYQNNDSNDLALQTNAVASSESILDFGEPDITNFRPLDSTFGTVFPQSESFLEKAQVFLKNTNDFSLELNVELQELNRIWDRDSGKVIKKTKVMIEPNFQGWVDVPFQAITTAGKPLRLVIHQAEGVFWADSMEFPTGTNVQVFATAPGGCEPKNNHIKTLQPHETAIPIYELWTAIRSRMPLSLKITPSSKPYKASNINNGHAWPLGMPNLWVSDPKQSFPQSLTLNFNGITSFNAVYISFDTHLDYAYQKMKAFWTPSATVKDWRLLALVNNKWEEIFSEKENHNRRKEVRFPSVNATAIKLEIFNTNKPAKEFLSTESRAAAEQAQGDSARVYEVRVYQE